MKMLPTLETKFCIFLVDVLTPKGRSHVQHLRIEHDFAEKHVFECCDGSGAVDGVVALERLIEVGVSCLPIFLLCCMNDPWKHVSAHVNPSWQHWSEACFD